ncbi:hypothetical protein HD553DRAFT_323165 [Filobasidium floriforme]|uniref:uncharacterized protein n=1 Tax=Filobasidium floriforme TaxID=5210 RepID=UPI001E8DD1B1|nr:uncharacterized protein HD553DRAFT_323165 [Filobasidium floriforme]KAH8086971.1 hypothetical protein HD553DRAFT_323165 [Filobasidium floriforme]
MERALPPPTFIRQFGTPKHLDPNETYDLLSSFLVAQTSKAHYAPSTQTSQLERLTDVIGIQIGAVDPTDAEEHERERERLEAEERDRLKKAREDALGVQEEEAEEMVKEEEQQVAEQRDDDDEDELDDGEEDEADSDEEGAPLPSNEKGQEQDELEDEDEDAPAFVGRLLEPWVAASDPPACLAPQAVSSGCQPLSTQDLLLPSKTENSALRPTILIFLKHITWTTSLDVSPFEVRRSLSTHSPHSLYARPCTTIIIATGMTIIITTGMTIMSRFVVTRHGYPLRPVHFSL